jgi:hypothetical protein
LLSQIFTFYFSTWIEFALNWAQTRTPRKTPVSSGDCQVIKALKRNTAVSTFTRTKAPRIQILITLTCKEFLMLDCAEVLLKTMFLVLKEAIIFFCIGLFQSLFYTSLTNKTNFSFFWLRKLERN